MATRIKRGVIGVMVKRKLGEHDIKHSFVTKVVVFSNLEHGVVELRKQNRSGCTVKHSLINSQSHDHHSTEVVRNIGPGSSERCFGIVMFTQPLVSPRTYNVCNAGKLNASTLESQLEWPKPQLKKWFPCEVGWKTFALLMCLLSAHTLPHSLVSTTSGILEIWRWDSGTQ